MMDFDGLEGKKIFVILKNKRQYSGRVLSVENNLILIKDKFSKNVYISSDEIYILEEEFE